MVVAFDRMDIDPFAVSMLATNSSLPLLLLGLLLSLPWSTIVCFLKIALKLQGKFWQGSHAKFVR